MNDDPCSLLGDGGKRHHELFRTEQERKTDCYLAIFVSSTRFLHEHLTEEGLRYNASTIIGGAINLAINYNDKTAGGLAPKTYIVFICLVSD